MSAAILITMQCHYPPGGGHSPGMPTAGHSATKATLSAALTEPRPLCTLFRSSSSTHETPGTAGPRQVPFLFLVSFPALLATLANMPPVPNPAV